MNEKIRAVVFDLGNTLIKIDFKPFLMNLGLYGKYSEQDIYKLLETPTQKYESGKITSEMFFEDAARELNLDISFDRFKHAWCSVATEFVEGMEELLKEINRKKILYLLSNTNELHFHYIMDNFPQLKCFKNFFLSYQTESMKPDPVIYRHMLEHVSETSAELLFIDDRQINIEAALQVGIDSIHFIGYIDLMSKLNSKNILE
jgi:glucose-1-phosphatase